MSANKEEKLVKYPCMCSVAQSRLTLCHPMDCSLPGFSVHEISQAWLLEWAAISWLQRVLSCNSFIQIVMLRISRHSAPHSVWGWSCRIRAQCLGQKLPSQLFPKYSRQYTEGVMPRVGPGHQGQRIPPGAGELSWSFIEMSGTWK